MIKVGSDESFKYILNIQLTMAVKQVLPIGIDFSRYVGEWVVICEDKLVAHNKKLTNVEKEIRECKRTPVIAKIPEKETLIF